MKQQFAKKRVDGRIKMIEAGSHMTYWNEHEDTYFPGLGSDQQDMYKFQAKRDEKDKLAPVEIWPPPRSAAEKLSTRRGCDFISEGQVELFDELKAEDSSDDEAVPIYAIGKTKMNRCIEK